MLRPSWTTPSILAFAHLHSQNNYDAHPFGILGSKVELYVMPRQRKSCEAHTKREYFPGPAWEHYRYYLVWVEDTRSTRVRRTVFLATSISQCHRIRKVTPDLCQQYIVHSADRGRTIKQPDQTGSQHPDGHFLMESQGGKGSRGPPKDPTGICASSKGAHRPTEGCTDRWPIRREPP